MSDVKFNPKSASLRHTRFGGSPYQVWEDADGNFLLMCESKHDSGRVFLPAKAIDAYKALPCEGTRYIRFRHAGVRFDETCKLDDAPLGVPFAADSGLPARYLVSQRDFSAEYKSERTAMATGTLTLPDYCGSSLEPPF